MKTPLAHRLPRLRLWVKLRICCTAIRQRIICRCARRLPRLLICVLNNENLIISCFVGLILAWQLELLACELRTTNNEFVLILLLLITSFSPVATIFFEVSEIKNLIFLISILIGIFYLTFKDISISTFGNAYLVTFISFFLVSFFVSKTFSENLDYLTFLFLILFFIRLVILFFLALRVLEKLL